jgi:hypothetical protein
MAADCKSAAPCELRRFESSPVHHSSLRGFAGRKPAAEILRECEGSDFESFDHRVGCVRDFGSAGLDHTVGSETSPGDARNFGAICAEVMGAAERCDAP